MQILQVKRYHGEIADRKYQRHTDNRPQSMFYFMLEDRNGYPTEKRQKGYVAFDDNRACFGMSPDKAMEIFGQ